MEQQPVNQNQNFQPETQNNQSLSKTWQIVAIIVAGILVIGGVSYGSYYLWQKSTGNVNQKACTMEAKLCPDGSYVGRSGANCEFAACPTSVSISQSQEIKTYVNTAYGYQFDYFKGLVSISAMDRGIIKPLTDPGVKTTNNLVVGDGSGHQDVIQVLVSRNQEEVEALFNIQKLRDTTIWSTPTEVIINEIQFSKYVVKNSPYNDVIEAYYATDNKNYFYIGLSNKTEGTKLLSTFKFTK